MRCLSLWRGLAVVEVSVEYRGEIRQMRIVMLMTTSECVWMFRPEGCNNVDARAS